MWRVGLRGGGRGEGGALSEDTLVPRAEQGGGAVAGEAGPQTAQLVPRRPHAERLSSDPRRTLARYGHLPGRTGPFCRHRLRHRPIAAERFAVGILNVRIRHDRYVERGRDCPREGVPLNAGASARRGSAGQAVVDGPPDGSGLGRLAVLWEWRPMNRDDRGAGLVGFTEGAVEGRGIVDRVWWQSEDLSAPGQFGFFGHEGVGEDR